MFLDVTENPLTLDNMTKMIFPFTNFTLFYLNQFPGFPNFLPSIEQSHSQTSRQNTSQSTAVLNEEIITVPVFGYLI